MNSRHLLAVAFARFLLVPLTTHAHDYRFDGKISRPVLENYLSRSMTGCSSTSIPFGPGIEERLNGTLFIIGWLLLAIGALGLWRK